MKPALDLYAKHPVKCNIGMYAVLYSSAEISQQSIMGYEEYNYTTAGHMALVGSSFFGPFYYHWYRFLDRLIPGKLPLTVIKKCLVDQAVAGSISVCVFFPCK